MIIRRMTQDDVKRIAQIESECFSLPWSESSFEDSLAREDTIFLVCVDEEVVGYVGMYLSFEEGEITNVAVTPSYRKRGCGNLLIRGIKEEAKARNAECIILEVRVSNAPAIALYQKHGFEQIGIRKNFYEYPTEDAIIMKVGI